MRDEKSPNGALSHASSPIPHPSSLILLADDNADMREYARRLLSGQYEVVAVADGEEALKAARERAFDLILADVAKGARFVLTIPSEVDE